MNNLIENIIVIVIIATTIILIGRSLYKSITDKSNKQDCAGGCCQGCTYKNFTKIDCGKIDTINTQTEYKK